MNPAVWVERHGRGRPDDPALADGERIHATWAEKGLGVFAVEEVGGAPFIGFVGLMVPSFVTSFTPCVEIGWRLAQAHWGKGFAQEAARAVLDWGFEHHALAEIVSFTVPANFRSRRVMEAVGMLRDLHGDFDHPRLPAGHALQRHVLYRLSAALWQQRRQDA